MLLVGTLTMVYSKCKNVHFKTFFDECNCNPLIEYCFGRYIKEFAVKFKEHTAMFSLDDKCKVNVGEPNYPIAAVARGKQVM